MKLFFEHQNFFHPSVAPYRGKLMMIMHKILAMDRFTAPYFCFSEDNGASWSEPQEIPALKEFQKCADFRPLTLADDSMAGIVGLVYNGKNYKSVYLFYDGEWSEAKDIPGIEYADDRAANPQTAVAPDGTLVIPFFYLREDKTFATVCRKYKIEGKNLIHLATGNSLINSMGRGLYEPSVVEWKGRFYLTLRCDENCAYFACSDDGLNWGTPVKWSFSDGTAFETSPTQQHWMKKKDELWLVYTRHADSNEDCFRWRTPMFAAPFDTEKMTLDKTREEIVLPRIDYRERPGLYGNFNVTNLKDRVFISDAPLWFDWTEDRNAIAWFSASTALKIIEL